MAVITGLATLTAYGRGAEQLWAGLLGGVPARTPVTRFDVGARRARYAATLPGDPDLTDELATLVDQACGQAGLTADQRAETPLLLARQPTGAVDRATAGLAAACGLLGLQRIHTNACAAAGSAVADAAALIALGEHPRVVVAAGQLVDATGFASFDSAGVLAPDGIARPFSLGRQGPVLGDGAGALVIEAPTEARRRGAAPLVRLAGWGQAGDAHHVARPHPQGLGIARATAAALRRAGLAPEAIGYVNAHATATPRFDPSEAAGLYRALGPHAHRVPVSSTKALHGHCLTAAGMVELAVCALALRHGLLPVNAGHLGPDPDCPLELVLDRPRPARVRHALSLSAGFGGTCTALLLEAV
ncbi:beta-ketoacyl synthase N-terminal-like domain-containing protein [Kitasatospora sp. NPDC049258]|uniref:beta-ketoacyl-[acyl-carrier-protein] synthase family protein n=1 Tax=Kitasatospora sp. NPDC049258 TaxID=3155394 RepID=UPI003448E495